MGRGRAIRHRVVRRPTVVQSVRERNCDTGHRINYDNGDGKPDIGHEKADDTCCGQSSGVRTPVSHHRDRCSSGVRCRRTPALRYPITGIAKPTRADWPTVKRPSTLAPMRTHFAFRAVLVRAASPLGLVLPAVARAQPTDLTAVADRVFAAWNNTHGPGCAVGVARGGRTLLTRGYGMADLAGERPITPQTILESGSVAKQFTATAVLLLMQDGKLALEDDARKYLPELPTYGRTITVRNLLTHTSGLREWSNLVDWQGWPRGTRAHTHTDVFELITHQQALNYPVGDFYSYTNSGFLLLRTIVERVSGMSLARFTAERIFTPLGMTHTQWRDDFTKLVPGLAQAYARRADGWHVDMPFDNIIGAGGLLTTVGDWLVWNDALTKKSLGATVGDSITRQMRLTSGLEIQYALGLTVSRPKATLRWFVHSIAIRSALRPNCCANSGVTTKRVSSPSLAAGS